MHGSAALLVAAEMDRKEGRHKYIFTLPLLPSYRMKHPKLEMDAIETRRKAGKVGPVGHLILVCYQIEWKRIEQFPTQIYMASVLSDEMSKTGDGCNCNGYQKSWDGGSSLDT